MLTLLVDSDIIAYKAASVAQEEYDLDDGDDPFIVADEESAIKTVDHVIENLVDELEADRAIICLSDDDNNWRKTVLPSYKEHRDPADKPKALAAVKEHLFENYDSKRKPWLEADDVMGILQTHPKLVKGEKVIVSTDKDMFTIPGWLYNPDKHEEPVYVTKRDADMYHLYQTIIGDATDGYKGAPKAGPVAAQKLLVGAEDESPEELWKLVVELYESKGLTEEDALIQAQVARICRHTEYDFKKQTVKPWSPYGT